MRVPRPSPHLSRCAFTLLLCVGGLACAQAPAASSLDTKLPVVPDAGPKAPKDAGAVPEGPKLVLASASPTSIAGGQGANVTLTGEGFDEKTVVERDGEPLTVLSRTGTKLVVDFTPRGKGPALLQVRRGERRSTLVEVTVRNTPPKLGAIPTQVLEEEQPFALVVPVSDLDGDRLRVFADDLPPGARFDEVTRTFSFRPDFIQGGQRFTVQLTVVDNETSVKGHFTLEVKDTVHPPAPTITKTETVGQCQRLTLSQTTDAFLDNAGRTFTATVMVPKSATLATPAAVRIILHGFGGVPATNAGCSQSFRIDPHDELDTYWWGFGDGWAPSGPGTPSKVVYPYTARRVLHLLGWLLTNYAGADEERVFLDGSSMGGTGAMSLGLLWARHFAGIDARIGQAIPRNHRPSRMSQLTKLWGTPSQNLRDDSGSGTWDRQDLTRALRDEPEAKQQFLFTRHGKDDGTIHFGAVVMPSPLTGLRFLEALQQLHIGHYATWDEGGHGPADPVLGANWWDSGWSRMNDPQSFLRRDRPFPAFSRSSHDDDPGDGGGNGRQPYKAESGYAGVLSVVGDTGWNGAIAGARNRWLRWDTTQAVDTRVSVELRLQVKSGSGQAPRQEGYPNEGDLFTGQLPVLADVTPRRVKKFQLLPGELVKWEFAGRTGVVTTQSDGTVTVPQLPITTGWQTLKLTRAP